MTEIIVEDLPVEDGATTPQPATNVDAVEHLTLAPSFRIDSPSKEESNKMAEVWAFGKELSKTKEIHDIIWQVKHLMLTLGAPTPGESSLDRIYRYAKLRRQERMIQEELKRI